MTRKTGRIVDVACGQYSSFLISEKGVVLGFGLTNCYQMGFPDREINRLTNADVSGHFRIILDYSTDYIR